MGFRFFIPVINRGKERIDKGKLKVDIYSGGEIVQTLKSNETTIGPLEREELILEWATDVEGIYKAVITFDYDGEIVQLEKDFNVGMDILEVAQIYVKDFQLGEIAKFNVMLDNNAEEEFKNVYFSISVYDEEGGIVGNFKSPTSESLPLGRSEISAYWDTEDMDVNAYNAKFELVYDGGKIERNIQIAVEEDKIIVTGATGYAIVGGGSGYLTKNLLIFVIIILVIIIAVLVIILKLRKKQKKLKK